MKWCLVVYVNWFMFVHLNQLSRQLHFIWIWPSSGQNDLYNSELLCLWFDSNPELLDHQTISIPVVNLQLAYFVAVQTIHRWLYRSLLELVILALSVAWRLISFSSSVFPLTNILSMNFRWCLSIYIRKIMKAGTCMDFVRHSTYPKIS